jgi:SAM-dependent methyltransferase
MQLDQHQAEIEQNLRYWERKPLLREIYAGFYARITGLIDGQLPGGVLEIGSGIGNLKNYYPSAICSDLFPNPWLDLVCDGYELPFGTAALSHLVLFDVFHHLEKPQAFFKEALRVLAPEGRLIIFDPYISLASFPVYGLLHHEPVAWRKPISDAASSTRPRNYYAAQGNATRIFFTDDKADLEQKWRVIHREAFAGFSYLFSGGYSKPAMYPRRLLPLLRSLDRQLSCCPRLFAARCLVAMTPA